MKILEVFFENFQYLEVKFYIYMNRCVFVIKGRSVDCRGAKASSSDKFMSKNFGTVFLA